MVAPSTLPSLPASLHWQDAGTQTFPCDNHQRAPPPHTPPQHQGYTRIHKRIDIHTLFMRSHTHRHTNILFFLLNAASLLGYLYCAGTKSTVGVLCKTWAVVVSAVRGKTCSCEETIPPQNHIVLSTYLVII